MRDATIQYLQKSLSIIDGLKIDGKKSTLFGESGVDLVFTRSGVFTELSNPYTANGLLEYRNVTIPEGVSIQGNTFYGGDVSGSRPFYLKVNGTLTVNGKLNMDGLGQQGFSDGVKSNHDAYYSENFNDLGYTLPVVGNGGQLSYKNWKNLYDYGLVHSFLSPKTCLVGAGSGMSNKYKKKSSRKYYYRHSQRSTALNSSGFVWDMNDRTGSGGGFLALYYENLDYQGPTWNGYPTNINCNGGGTYWGAGHTRDPWWGGGCMIIAAKNIVVGPKGSITCNPCQASHRSVTGNFYLYDSDNNSGGISYLNRYAARDIDYAFGSFRSMDAKSGGGGVCLGYKVSQVFREQNR